jgi:hypothetical protein
MHIGTTNAIRHELGELVLWQNCIHSNARFSATVDTTRKFMLTLLALMNYFRAIVQNKEKSLTLI